MTTTNDFVVRNEGNIFLLRALTPAGRAWMAEHISEDAITWGDATVIEHRFIEAVLCGAAADGLTVGGD